MSDMLAQDIAERIIADVADRRGIGDEWESISEEIQNEIRGEWARIIEEGFKGELGRQAAAIKIHHR